MQLTHCITLGVNPNKVNNLNLNMLIIKSLSLSVSDILYKAFKNTGDINTYLELKQIENIENKIEKNDIKIEEKNMK